MPFYLVDRIEEIAPGESLCAVKCISLAEEIFRDHFPGQPIYPGVLLVESGLQAAAILLEAERDFAVKALPAMLDEVRFRHPVHPGDRLRITARKLRGATDQARCTIEVASDGHDCVTRLEATFKLAPIEVLGVAREAYLHYARTLLATATTVGTRVEPV